MKNSSLAAAKNISFEEIRVNCYLQYFSPISTTVCKCRVYACDGDLSIVGTCSSYKC